MCSFSFFFLSFVFSWPLQCQVFGSFFISNRTCRRKFWTYLTGLRDLHRVTYALLGSCIPLRGFFVRTSLPPRVSLAPKTPFPFPFKRLPRRLCQDGRSKQYKAPREICQSFLFPTKILFLHAQQKTQKNGSHWRTDVVTDTHLIKTKEDIFITSLTLIIYNISWLTTKKIRKFFCFLLFR